MHSFVGGKEYNILFRIRYYYCYFCASNTNASVLRIHYYCGRFFPDFRKCPRFDAVLLCIIITVFVVVVVVVVVVIIFYPVHIIFDRSSLVFKKVSNFS